MLIRYAAGATAKLRAAELRHATGPACRVVAGTSYLGVGGCLRSLVRCRSSSMPPCNRQPISGPPSGCHGCSSRCWCVLPLPPGMRSPSGGPGLLHNPPTMTPAPRQARRAEGTVRRVRSTLRTARHPLPDGPQRTADPTCWKMTND